MVSTDSVNGTVFHQSDSSFLIMVIYFWVSNANNFFNSLSSKLKNVNISRCINHLSIALLLFTIVASSDINVIFYRPISYTEICFTIASITENQPEYISSSR